MQKPSLGWQSWSPPFPKWHGYPRWDYSPLKTRKLRWSKVASSSKTANMRYWCSWYAYGWNINHEKIISTLDVIRNHNLLFTHVLIDDGWTSWGDWHKPDISRFSNLADTIQLIHAHKLKAGLWFAPFLADKKSQLFKNHPDWFVKYRGKSVWGLQTIPIWEWILPRQYLLNLEIPQVKKYLTDFIDLAVKEWRVDLFKLDFLYAPYFNPHLKSDRIAHNQVAWLFRYIKSNYPKVQTIACGAPFAPTLGLAGSIRISKDTALPPLFPKIISRWIYSNRVIMLFQKLPLIRRKPLLVTDPDVRMFRLDTQATQNMWDTLSTSILGIGDNLTDISLEKIEEMKLWLTNHNSQ